eukprot:4372629-Alexandrium_andersonii.AAC.1
MCGNGGDMEQRVCSSMTGQVQWNGGGRKSKGPKTKRCTSEIRGHDVDFGRTAKCNLLGWHYGLASVGIKS